MVMAAEGKQKYFLQTWIMVSETNTTRPVTVFENVAYSATMGEQKFWTPAAARGQGKPFSSQIKHPLGKNACPKGDQRILGKVLLPLPLFSVSCYEANRISIGLSREKFLSFILGKQNE